ncbi:ABC transporter substrate-binding protein [Seohaeicola zhoushanensis]|uniref:Peptide ABC transporter substrate-binding protein n=1 Tax=Seohaeicola zhoushanensis TaxID=1569283 RepID=A0A8J3GV91_9RHOB|nr:peptide ABC transporter substrate-binding protein [Seohaeicola zhoushanensis]
MSRIVHSFAFVLAGMLAGPAAAADLQESPYWAEKIGKGELPAISERVPAEPLVVDLEAKGRTSGTPGGTLTTLVSRDKDIRMMVVYGYARLVGFDKDYNLVPDILASVDVQEGRVFTLHLRKGHRWSDGAPFTSADFAYWWDDVANNPELSPSGPPDFLRIDGKYPTVTTPDETTVVYAWDAPNPLFLQTLAQARPPFIYRPAHVMKQFHQKYADPTGLAEAVADARVKSWAALHNGLDNMYDFDNPELPTLQPWVNTSDGKKIRHQFVRNPYYHRVDSHGIQLPYIDVVEMEIVSGGLIAAKANAGETDLQGRGLDFRDIPILKKGEADGKPYRTLLWANGTASQIAIYPNLNCADDTWRTVLRDVRVRRALSLAIDRAAINRALFFKMAKPGAMSVLPQSPFFEEENREAWAAFDTAQANALLDEAGLAKKGGDGIRLLPDGRPMELVIEVAGERQEEENALQIVTDTWREIGVKLVMRPLDRDILRNRVYAGTSMASAWFGWDNGIPQAYTSPDYLAPRQQEFFAWPKWGQFYQTNGGAGEPPDMEAPKRLLDLSHEWEQTTDDTRRAEIWQEMLKIHADNVFGIGILNEAPQPIVVSTKLKNVPESAIWAWEPGAHFGIHRMDEFYFEGGKK